MAKNIDKIKILSLPAEVAIPNFDPSIDRNSFLTMKNTICIFLFLLASATVFSQGWERFFGTPDVTESAGGIVRTPDGGFFLTIAEGIGDEAQLIKLSPDGIEEWSVPLLASGYPPILGSASGGYFIVGLKNGNGEYVHAEVDLQGNIVWEIPAIGPDPTNWVALPDGFVNYFLDGPDEVELWKIDLNGELLWEDTVGVPGLIPGCGITATADGGFALGGHGNFDAMVAKFDGDGNLEFIANDGSPDHEAGNGTVVQTSDGGYVVVNDLSGPDQKPYINKFSSTGTLEWSTFYDPPIGDATYYVNSIIEDADGNIVMAGRADDLVSNAYLLKFSGDGIFQFYKAYNGQWFTHLLETQDGYYCAAGYGINGGNLGDAYVILADSDGITFPNFVQGQVALDEDQSCTISAGDQLLEGWTVRAQGAYTYLVTTDADGSYSIPLDLGNFTIEIFPPSDLWSPCENPVDVTLSNLGDTVQVDFPIQAAIDCPAMQVDIGTPFLRRCFDNYLTVQYCNLGTVIAEDATIEVTLDSLLEFVSSEITPSGQTGNTYTFPLGDLEVNECGSFKITAFVNCDSELGQSLCMEAHAYPDTICGMPFNWSGASMEARAYCDGDSTVILELENVGSVPTSQALEYIVIEDQIIFLEDEQVFDPMEIWNFTQEANGATWRVICEQEPNHPGFSFPTAFVEGCGINAGGGFSIGFVNEHPLADGDGFIDIDCEEVVASFDPNDKAGFPRGYDDEHYIEPNTDIEYKIRFQNTGTDTAFNVVIRDTLSLLLDPTTLRPGAASHDYEFEWEGNGVAVFRFPNIMLPDSNVNEPLSHGFVTFKISQDLDLPPGVQINNSAAIYFDFNEPIITNTTYHTIEEDFIIASINEPDVVGVEVKVYPNPFVESATFEVEGVDNQQLTLNFFDSAGRLVRQENFAEGKLQFQREDLRAGIWFFRIDADGAAVGSGKLVIVGH